MCGTGVARFARSITNCDGHNEVANKLKKSKTRQVYKLHLWFCKIC